MGNKRKERKVEKKEPEHAAEEQMNEGRGRRESLRYV